MITCCNSLISLFNFLFSSSSIQFFLFKTSNCSNVNGAASISLTHSDIFFPFHPVPRKILILRPVQPLTTIATPIAPRLLHPAHGCSAHRTICSVSPCICNRPDWDLLFQGVDTIVTVCYCQKRFLRKILWKDHSFFPLQTLLYC